MNNKKVKNIKKSKLDVIFSDSQIMELLKEFEEFIPWQFGKVKDVDPEVGREILKLILNN